ncbi:MAG: hypothetical protein ACP5IX_00215 [Patescibacteria group bacterium]
MKKEKILTSQTIESKADYLKQDLKKLLIIILILAVVLIGLALIDSKINILTKLAEQIIPKR